MYIGDRVKVIKAYDGDIAITEGYTGVIIEEFLSNDGDYDDVFNVRFDIDLSQFLGRDKSLSDDGTYFMCREQLEVIEEKEQKVKNPTEELDVVLKELNE